MCAICIVILSFRFWDNNNGCTKDVLRLIHMYINRLLVIDFKVEDNPDLISIQILTLTLTLIIKKVVEEDNA